MDQMLLGLTALSVRRVNPWILFATLFRKLLFVPRNDGLEDHLEDESLRGLLPISSLASGRSTLATPRDRTQSGMRAEHVGEAALSAPAFECTADGSSRTLSESEDEVDILRTRRNGTRIALTLTTRRTEDLVGHEAADVVEDAASGDSLRPSMREFCAPLRDSGQP